MPMLDVKGVGQTLSSLNSILMIFCNFSEGFFLPKKTPGFIYTLKNQALERGNAMGPGCPELSIDQKHRLTTHRYT